MEKKKKFVIEAENSHKSCFENDDDDENFKVNNVLETIHNLF